MTAPTPTPAPADDPHAEGPLSGVRVLDMSSVVMGPLATQILGDLGADVIAVETARGETNRSMGAGPHPALSGVSLNLLRNKRNIAVDLKVPEGREALLRVAATCDVFLTNLRPAPLGRLRLAYDDVAAVRPDVVYCQAQGWPTDGDRADEPAYDDVVQAAAGVADAVHRMTGSPALTPTLLADKVCGLTVAYALLAALFRRERTGRGEHLEVPMVDALRAFVLVEHGSGAIGRPPQRQAGYSRILTPFRRPQRSADGWVHVFPYLDQHWDAILRAGGQDDAVGDPRLARAARMADSSFAYQQLEAAVATRTTAEWLAFCRDRGIPATEVATLDELVDALPEAEHPEAGPYKVIPPPVRFRHHPPSVRRHAPLPGQHTLEVLAEVGLGEDDLARLQAAGALPAPSGATAGPTGDDAEAPSAP